MSMYTMDSDDPMLPAFLEHALKTRLLGPGCGRAEFEGADWRDQATLRMTTGFRPGLVYLFNEWKAAEKDPLARPDGRV